MSKKWRKAPRIEANSAPLRCFGASEDLAFECAADGADGKKTLGKFSMTAYTGGPMRLSGYSLPIVLDLSSVRVPNQSVPVPINHDVERIAGHTTRIEVTAQKIRASGVLSGDNEHSTRVSATAKNGFPWQASVGGDQPSSMERINEGESVKVNGRNLHGPLLVAKGVTIREISFTPIGADGNTSADIAAQAGVDPMFEAWLKAMGKDSATLSEAEKAALKAQYDATAPPSPRPPTPPTPPAPTPPTPPPSPDDQLKAMRENYAKETERTAALQGIAARYEVSEIEVDDPAQPGQKARVNLMAHAVRHGWTADQTELAALRAARPKVQGGLAYSTTTPGISDAVLEAAVLQAGGNSFRLMDNEFYERDEHGQRRCTQAQQGRIMGELKDRYTDKVQQAAHSLFKGRIGFQQLLTMVAAAHGYRGSEVIRDGGAWGDVSHYLARSALPIQADGSSLISIANVLANVQNKYLLQGYLFTEQAFMQICQTVPVKDFKATKSVALFGDMEFRPLGVGGEIQHGTLFDQAFANQAALMARMLTIPLQFIVNDDMGILGQVPMMLGRGWGLAVNKLVWTVFNNPGFDDGGTTNFFAATHTIPGQPANSNLATGGGSTLTSAGLSAAKLLLDKQIDPAGNPLSLDAEILLYPPELDTAAIELMNSQFIIMGGLASTSAASKQPSNNIWKGRFTPVMSRYLSDAAYTGYSATAWYLLANSAMMPAMQIAAWNGNMVPTVQTSGQDWQFNILGITMRGYGGIGVTKQNFRGVVKSAGA